jgi:hypothetical protein
MSQLRLSAWLCIGAIVSGCNQRTDRFRNYEYQAGDLGSFIIKKTPLFVAVVVKTNPVSEFQGRWFYNVSDNTLEVFVEGDCFYELHKLLSDVMGSPYVRTNNAVSRTTPVLKSYYGQSAGVVVSAGSAAMVDGKPYTTLVIIGSGRLKDTSGYTNKGLPLPPQTNAIAGVISPARSAGVYVSEFFRCFPSAKVRQGSVGAGSGFEVNVDLFQRYEFTMQLVVQYDSLKRIVSHDEPLFYIREVVGVDIGLAEKPVIRIGEQRQFGAAEWKRLVDAGGDFRAIGFKIITNEPVAHFNDRKVIQ